MLCFFYGKIVPLSGGRAACGGGGKVQFMRGGAGMPARIFLDRRTEVHKVTSKQADSRVSKVNGIAVIDGRSQAELCDNVEH